MGKIVKEIRLANNALKHCDNEITVHFAQINLLLSESALHGYNRLLQLRQTKEVLFFTTAISSKHFAGIIAEIIDDNGHMIANVLGHNNGVILIVTDCDLSVFYEIIDILPDRFSSSFFSKHELTINPTMSSMTLDHKIAGPADTTKLREWKIESTKLPALLMKDAQRRWHDFSPGQVIVVRRGKSDYFRIVR